MAGCGHPSTQDVTHSPAPTLDTTLLVAARATPAPTPGATLSVAATATRARDALAGTRWVLLTLNDEPLLEGTRITLEFSGGFVRGSAGCNKYDRVAIGDDVAGAKYKATEDGSLRIPGLMSTLLACPTPEGVMDQEDAYLEALRSAAAYRLVENRLEIQDAADETILVFTR